MLNNYGKFIQDKKLCMFLLAIFPVFGYYMTPWTISYGQIMFYVFFLFVFFKGRHNLLFLPREYMLFWIYVAIALLVTSAQFKITYLIPGGLHFFQWSLCLGIVIPFLDFEYFRKYLKWVYIISAVVFVLQEIMYYRVGYRFSALLPICNNFYGKLSYMEMSLLQMYGARSSSLFLEPAYYAHFLVFVLTIELFSATKNTLWNKLLLLSLVVVLVFLRSGSGMFGLAVVFLIKYLSAFKRLTFSRVFFVSILIMPLFYFIINQYLNSEIGSNMLSRQEELMQENSSGYIRIFKGFDIYSSLPLINQFFGCSFEDMVRYTGAKGIEVQVGNMATNGIQTILVQNGLIGLLFLFLFYFKQYKHGNSLCKTLVWILLAISFIESIYLTPLMLVMSAFIVYFARNNFNSGEV